MRSSAVTSVWYMIVCINKGERQRCETKLLLSLQLDNDLTQAGKLSNRVLTPC